MRLCVSRVSATLLVLAAVASAQRAPLPGEAGHGAAPTLDWRLGPDGLRPEISSAITASRSEADVQAREADLQSLREQIPGLSLTTDPHLGTPMFLRSTRRFLTEPVPGAFTARGVATDFVSRHRGLFEIDPLEVETGRAVRDFVTRHNGVSHLTLQQEAGGLEIHGALLKANVTADGALVNVSSTLLPRPEGDFAWPDVVISARAALTSAAADVGMQLTSTPASKGSASGTSQYQEWQPGSDFRADVPVSTELLLYPRTRTQLHPTWRVVVPEPGVGNTYEVYVDAVDGTILLRGNRLRWFAAGGEDLTLNVWTGDSPAPLSPASPDPTGFQPAITARTLVTVGPTVASPEGWIPDGVNEPVGNNVDAHLDLDGDNLPDLPRPQGSPYRVFDFPVDLGLEPDTYRDASVIQGFYYMNVAHDRLYALGFDEAAGNFQTDNFGLGGLAADAISLDCQDGSGTNNANWNGDNEDGTPAWIQMYVFDRPVPHRDGDFDGDMAYHEYAHGLSHRLIPELSGFSDVGGGLGEGWSDYFAISLNAEPGDDPDATYAYSAYIGKDLFDDGDNNYYWGVRRYPYTTDMSRSPLTYADTDQAQIEIPDGIPVNTSVALFGANEVHNAGEIWANALLECRARLWNSGLGFDANELMMQLAVDGMKLMPNSSSYVVARDAIINADMVNSGGAHTALLWAGFAKRGLGKDADAPLPYVFTGVEESFDTPPLLEARFPEGSPDQLVPGLATAFAITIEGLMGANPLPGTATLHSSINGGPYATTPMTPAGLDTYEATLPPTACLDMVDWYVSMETDAGPASVPDAAPAEGFSSTSFVAQDVFLDDDFEIDSGWIIGAIGDTATDGQWVRGDPNGTAAQPENDHTPLGTDCWFTGQGNVGGSVGSADVDGGTTTLVSPVIDLSSGDAEISYWRWFDISEGGTPFGDRMTVEISNGGDWTVVETLGPAKGPDTIGGWVFHTFRVSDYLRPNATVSLRFRASDTFLSSVVEAAVDDVIVRRLSCESCQTDLGLSGPGDLSLSLCGPTLVSGSQGELQIENGPPEGKAMLVVGLTADPTPFLGGRLLPVPILALVDVPLNASGSATFDARGGGGPLTVYLQAVALDASQPQGYEFSQALEVFLGP